MDSDNENINDNIAQLKERMKYLKNKIDSYERKEIESNNKNTITSESYLESYLSNPVNFMEYYEI